MPDAITLLCPVPREVGRRTLTCRSGDALLVRRAPSAATAEIDRLLTTVTTNWRRRGLPRFVDRPSDGRTGDEVTLELALDPATGVQEESYRLDIDATTIRLVAPRPVGIYRGFMTLAQWMILHADPGHEGLLPGLHVIDAPDLPRRGVLLDISRDRVPTMESLFGLVERLAEWKINQLQLYTEHTFAYAGHEVVWRDTSPMTGEEIEALDSYCKERFIELVPNQNSFGHFHRWLKHPAYRSLAECPEGIEHPFSREREPFSLCAVDPRSLELLADLYDQLLPHFSSGLFNVGLDETFDLGMGRSAAACDERGKHAVYLDFLRQVHHLVEERGHRMQFWGDIVLEAGGGADGIPPTAIPLAWGYEADHPFDRDLGRLRSSGLSFYACPGTSSWRSLGGRTGNALGNLCNAAGAARRHGAEGLLITDWGDEGHLQPPPVSYCGLLAGACWAWNSRTAEPHDFDIGAALECHAFRGPTGAGPAFARIGEVGRASGAPIRNGTVLFYLLVSPHDDLEHPRYEALTNAGLESARASIDAARSCLGPAPARPRAEADLVRREFDWVANLLSVACELGAARLAAGRTTPIAALPTPVRKRLADAYAPLVEQHGALWLARSRPGGREDSVSHLTGLLDALRADEPPH